MFQACLTIVAFLAFAGTGLADDRVIVRGDNEYQPLRLKELSPNTSIDLNGARFRVAISGNDNPTEAQPCKDGTAPINRYPFAIEDSPEVRIDGGVFMGETPLESDWLHTYCNSTAVRLENSPRASVREVRMRRVWDGIRIDTGTDQFRIARVWMSEVRDDCIENDHLMEGRIRDSLFDGCFAGISVAPIDDSKGQPTIRVERLLMRMQQYVYRGKLGHAMPIKVQKAGGAKFDIRDSIFALETTNLIGGKHIDLMWDAISKCKNNRLLWLGDGDLPEIYAGVPSCFEVITGDEAKTIWRQERRSWIADNKGVARFTSDIGE